MSQYDKLKELALAATPGPWVAQNYDDYWCLDTTERPADYFVDSDNTLGINSFDKTSRAEADIKYIAEANPATILALIAQRDELLSALQSVVAVWDDIYPDMESGKYPQERLEDSEFTEMQAAREAIAKAVQP